MQAEVRVAINNLHPSLKFTIEREENGCIAFLDMKLIHENNSVSSTWYNKPTDTGLIMNFHALAPKRYKHSVVSGFVHRIFRACSTWNHFHESLEKAKKILECNQYPPTFYNPIIKQTLDSIITPEKEPPTPMDKKQEPSQKFPVIIQYRGKCSEEYARSLHKIQAPCTIVMTLRKLKTTLPSLKPPIEKMLRSGIVYKISCPRCLACYVGQTSRHLLSRFKEHIGNNGTMKHHMSQCQSTITEDDIEILASTSRGEPRLLTLEALYIEELKPALNTKDEYRSRTLTIKL